MADVNGFRPRLDVITLFDEKYEIRNGTGVGVGAPEWGGRRGFFFRPFQCPLMLYCPCSHRYRQP
jgi:hypothetical protein